jgi:hypothetical protein
MSYIIIGKLVQYTKTQHTLEKWNTTTVFAEGLTAELVLGWEFKSLPQNIHDFELCKGFPMEKKAQIHLILKIK